MLQVHKKCPDFSSVWLVAVNFIYFICGIILIALSAWGINASNDDPVLAALPAGGLVTLVIVGVALMCIAIVGWAGVKFNYKVGGRYVLGIYATLLIILMIMEFAAAGALLTFTGLLDEFGPALAVKEYGVYYLVNQSYAECCCGPYPCPNGSCWIPGSVNYPCDSLTRFSAFLSDYITERIQPVGAFAIVLGLFQFVTAITACCNQCKGRKVEEAKKIGGPLSYDGLYSEGEEAYSGYGYESYVKTGAAGGKPGAAAAAGAKPGAAAAGGKAAEGATAPKVGAGRPAAGARTAAGKK